MFSNHVYDKAKGTSTSPETSTCEYITQSQIFDSNVRSRCCFHECRDSGQKKCSLKILLIVGEQTNTYVSVILHIFIFTLSTLVICYMLEGSLPAAKITLHWTNCHLNYCYDQFGNSDGYQYYTSVHLSGQQTRPMPPGRVVSSGQRQGK